MTRKPLSYAEAAESLFRQGSPGMSRSAPRPMTEQEIRELPDETPQYDSRARPPGFLVRHAQNLGGVADYVFQNPLGNAMIGATESYVTELGQGATERDALLEGLRGGVHEFHDSFREGIDPRTPTPYRSYREVPGMEDVPAWQIGLMDALSGAIGPTIGSVVGRAAGKVGRRTVREGGTGTLEDQGLLGRYVYGDMAINRARTARETPTRLARERGTSTSGNLDEVYRDTMQIVYDTADDSLKQMLTSDPLAREMVQGLVQEVHKGVRRAVRATTPGDLQQIHGRLMDSLVNDMGLDPRAAGAVSKEVINRSQQARRLFNTDPVARTFSHASNAFSRLAGVKTPVRMSAPIRAPKAPRLNRRELDQHLNDLDEAERMARMAQEGRTPLTTQEILQEARRRVRQANRTMPAGGGR